LKGKGTDARALAMASAPFAAPRAMERPIERTVCAASAASFLMCPGQGDRLIGDLQPGQDLVGAGLLAEQRLEAGQRLEVGVFLRRAALAGRLRRGDLLLALGLIDGGEVGAVARSAVISPPNAPPTRPKASSMCWAVLPAMLSSICISWVRSPSGSDVGRP
jgi:hypothetical protein